MKDAPTPHVNQKPDNDVDDDSVVGNIRLFHYLAVSRKQVNVHSETY